MDRRMRMHKAMISYCSDCYDQDYDDASGKPWCMRENRRIERLSRIPKWCPLPDWEETKKEHPK